MSSTGNYFFVTLTSADADLVASTLAVALTVTVDGVGIELGAWYKPELLTVPIEEFPPTTPFTLQVTPGFEEFSTEAVNCFV